MTKGSNPPSWEGSAVTGDAWGEVRARVEEFWMVQYHREGTIRVTMDLASRRTGAADREMRRVTHASTRGRGPRAMLTCGCSRGVVYEGDEGDEMVGEADGAQGRICLMMSGVPRLQVGLLKDGVRRIPSHSVFHCAVMIFATSAWIGFGWPTGGGGSS